LQIRRFFAARVVLATAVIVIGMLLLFTLYRVSQLLRAQKQMSSCMNRAGDL
jgi:hypothetical protein